MRIDDYLAIPFKDGGRDFVGCDCFGLIYLIYKHEYGINLKDYSISCEEASRINEEMNKQRYVWTKIPSPQVPSLVVIRLDSNPHFINHVGIVYKPGYFIHTTDKTGVTANNRYDSVLWKNRIEGFYVPTKGAEAE